MFNKISELHNPAFYVHLFILKFLSYEKLAMTSQFDLTRFYDAIICNSVFNSGIPDPCRAFKDFLLDQTGFKKQNHPFMRFQISFPQIWISILFILLILKLLILKLKEVLG